MQYEQLKRGPDGAAWVQSTANEIGRLTQGVLPHMLTGTNTMKFIPHSAKPTSKTATYLRIVASEKPNKTEPKRIRFTVGGDRIIYDGDVATPTADLTTIKLLLNSTLSTADAKFMTIDIKDFYLNTPMENYEYMRIPVRHIPDIIMTQYQLAPLIHNDHIMVEIQKGMYGLPQAGLLANKRLTAHLRAHGFIPAPHTPGLFTHDTRAIKFCLVVDDFGVQYVGRDNAEYLMTVLRATVQYHARLVGIPLLWSHTPLGLHSATRRCLHARVHPKST